MAKKSPSKTAARLATQSDLSGNAIPEITEALNGLEIGRASCRERV